MSYTYLASSAETGDPLAAFTRRHELERWCRLALEGAHHYTWNVDLWRVRSAPWDTESHIVKLKFESNTLIEVL